MKSPNRIPAHLWDMIDAIDQLQICLEGKTYENYLEEFLLQKAIERLLEILGEAARRIDREFHAQHPEIDWAQIIGLRNVIVHQYDDLDLEQLWEILHTSLPSLQERLRILLQEFDS